MKKINIKQVLIKTIKVILIIALVLQSISSILNIFSQDGIANYEAFRRVVGTTDAQIGFKRTKIVQYNESNPITKYMNPIYTLLILTEDKLGGYVIKFDRGLTQELYIKESNNISSFTLDNLDFDKAYEEAKNKLFAEFSKVESKSKVRYRGIPNTESYEQIGGFDVVEEYFDGLKPSMYQTTTFGLLIKDYSFLKLNVDDNTYLNSGIRTDVMGGGVHGSKYKGQPEVRTLLKDLDYPNAKFIALHFDGGIPMDGPYRGTSKLKDIRIIHKDRSIIEVPAKPDGSFDFESVKYKFR